MRENQKDSIDHTILLEGGSKYTNHPLDPGGATKWGITLRSLRNWRGRPTNKEDVRNLSHGEAYEIYVEEYWQKVRASELFHGLDYIVFDCAVNMGPTKAIKILQRSVHQTPDGVMGPLTMTAVKSRQGVPLIREYAARRMWRYGLLKRLFETFGLGWSRRLMDTYEVALRYNWRHH